MEKFYTGECFTQLECIGKELVGVTFEDCVFEHVRVEQCTVKNCLFTGCEFRNCKITETKFVNTQGLMNGFENCTLFGVDWSALLEERKRTMKLLPFDRIRRCTLRHCVFFGLDMRKFDLSSCDLGGCYFDGCNLQEANFYQAQLKDASFTQNDMRKADFRGASDYFFSLETNQAGKAKFSLPEAVNLLSALGIILEDR